MRDALSWVIMIKFFFIFQAADKNLMERLVANIRLPKHLQSGSPMAGGTFWKRLSVFQTRWEARKVLKNKIKLKIYLQH